MTDETFQFQQYQNPIQVQSFTMVLAVMLIMVFLGVGQSEGAQEAEPPALQSPRIGEPHTLQAHWDYLGVEGPEHWGMLTPKYMTCETGHKQSPINISMAHHGHHSETLTFRYHMSELHEMNNGHTVQVSHTSGCHIDLDDRTYQLRQFHFHEPSEHHIDGNTFPMEMHLVHQDERGHILVIAIMLEVGVEEPVLGQLWKWLPTQIGQDVSIPLDFHLSDILPTNTHHFSYSGSLTTPPCTEGVQWVILKKPILISQQDVAQFVHIIGHNARPTQPLEARQVEEY